MTVISRLMAGFLAMSSSVAFAAQVLYDVREFGAKPDGQTLCTEPIQKAVHDLVNRVRK